MNLAGMRHRTNAVPGNVVSTLGYSLGYSGTCSSPYGTTTEGTYANYQNTDKLILRDMYDVVTPNWKDCLKRGIIVNNPMMQETNIYTSLVGDFSIAAEIRKWMCSPGKYVYNGTKNWGTYPSSWYNFLLNSYAPTPTVDAESLMDQALHKAWSRQDLTQVQALVIAAEFGETLKSFQQAFEGFTKLMKSLRRSHGLSFIKELSGKSISEKFMYLRYALRPLIYDVVDTIKTLQMQSKKINSMMTTRGTCSDFVNYVDEGQHVYDKTWTSGVFIWADHQRVSYQRKTEVNIEARSGVLSRIEAISGLNTWGLDQPIEALWELVPLSFVVDWFLDVADTIGAWTPEFGLKALASWTVLTTTVYKSIRVTGSDRWCDGTGVESVNVHSVYNNFHVTETNIVKVRTPNPNLTLLPRIRVNLDPLKVIDLAIILRQFLSRH